MPFRCPSSVVNVWFLFALLPSLVFATCYCEDGGEIDACASSIPCPGVTSDSGVSLCCGSHDTCGADSICHFDTVVAQKSGYYLGGCTDPTFKDPICSSKCTEGFTSDIVYNSTADHWSCCAYPNNTVNCDSPTNISFSAISPNQFPGIDTSSSTTTSTTSIPSTTSPSSASTTPSSESSASNLPTFDRTKSSSGLSSGAKAGIGIGCAIGAIAIAGGIVFLLRRRKTNKEEGPAFVPEMGVSEHSEHSGEHYSSDIKLHELRTPDKPDQDQFFDSRKMIMPAELGSRQISELH